MTALRRYSIVLIPDSDAGGYGVLVPELPGCMTEGHSVESLGAEGEPEPSEVTPPELATVEV